MCACARARVLRVQVCVRVCCARAGVRLVQAAMLFPEQQQPSLALLCVVGYVCGVHDAAVGLHTRTGPATMRKSHFSFVCFKP